ncbi:hypothetical protein [Psychrobacter sp. DAB_AL32B]|uniref:hypothetical protein n=1 Tax=Psychrobacter sp. DAB_AL32B TaxID=1028414 RepID=UPI000B7F06E4|nr:hypothetical protein [Psychrobacter sp. DAB_AL32B]OXL23162.1 hypothetical protein CAN34_07710 [Psychrobacter sp. DAB_AL32B]
MTKHTGYIDKQKTTHILLKRVSPKTVMSGALFAALLASSGCATSSLLENNNQVSSTPSNNVLSEDQIVAFGRPAQALPKMPNATMVIVGEKNSYVLTQGGTEMVNLLTNLTPKNIQVDNEMKFYVPNNDGYFQGEMKLSYAKLKDEFKRSDYQFFLQNSGKECTSASDQRINAQRFCFSVPVKGAIYPQVSNLSLIQSNYRALSKPYMVSFYTQTQQTQVSRNGPNSAQKLVLLPFALAFDVITFPFQLLEQ